MLRSNFSLEELVEGPLYQGADDVENVPVEEVDEADMTETIIETADNGATVENAALFIQHSLEHLDAMSFIASRSHEASVEVNHKIDLTSGLKKIWAAIVEAFRRLVESITNFFTKVSNFIRSGGIKEKIAYIGRNSGKIDFKKIDGNKQVINPELITMCLKVNEFKVPNGFIEKVINIVGVDPTKLRAEVVEKSKSTVRLAEATGKVKSIATEANLTTFQKSISETLKAAKESHKAVSAAAKENADGDADKKKAAAANSRVVLKKISDASFLGVRGFSWFITAVNYTYSAIKSSESKAEPAKK